jgi:hypothetical protein
MDLLELYQLRMDKCASEQFWLLGLFTPVYAFLILKATSLMTCLSARALKGLLVFATALACGFILSRQLIYLHYDRLVNEIILALSKDEGFIPPATEGLWKHAALWSGTLFYCLIALTLMWLSWRAISGSSPPAQRDDKASAQEDCTDDDKR